jgi:hypothetical protein
MDIRVVKGKTLFAFCSIFLHSVASVRAWQS